MLLAILFLLLLLLLSACAHTHVYVVCGLNDLLPYLHLHLRHGLLSCLLLCFLPYLFRDLLPYHRHNLLLHRHGPIPRLRDNLLS